MLRFLHSPAWPCLHSVSSSGKTQTWNHHVSASGVLSLQASVTAPGLSPGLHVEASVQRHFKSLVHYDSVYPRLHECFILGNKLKQQQQQTTATTEVGQVWACSLSYLTGWGRRSLRPAWSTQWVPGQSGNFGRLSQNNSRKQVRIWVLGLECVRSSICHFWTFLFLEIN